MSLHPPAPLVSRIPDSQKPFEEAGGCPDIPPTIKTPSRSLKPSGGARLHPKQAAMLERVRGWMPSRVMPLERAYRGTCSPRVAIRLMCSSCMGYEDVVTQVGGCTAPACPLWAFRPYQVDQAKGKAATA